MTGLIVTGLLLGVAGVLAVVVVAVKRRSGLSRRDGASVPVISGSPASTALSRSPRPCATEQSSTVSRHEQKQAVHVTTDEGIVGGDLTASPHPMATLVAPVMSDALPNSNNSADDAQPARQSDAGAQKASEDRLDAAMRLAALTASPQDRQFLRQRDQSVQLSPVPLAVRSLVAGGSSHTHSKEPDSDPLAVLRSTLSDVVPSPHTLDAGFGAGLIESVDAERREEKPKGWLKPGEQVRIAGRTIPGGMMYVGQHLARISTHHEVEPALIDATLAIDSVSPDRDGQGMSYWPSYNSIPPSSRAAYLDWLAEGRCRPGAYIGYVFLFFYGIERRVLHDAPASSDAHAEIPALIAEVERLLSLYGQNRSFRGYAANFLEIAALVRGIKNRPSPPHVNSERASTIPLVVRLGVAYLANEGRPLDVQWALAWVRTDPEIPLRTPARRCQSEFDELFQRRYTARYGDGLPLRECKRTLTFEYRPASASFGGVIKAKSDLPDVTSLVSPRRQLSLLADECCDVLAAFSRWKGSQGHEDAEMEAVGLLPEELLDSHAPAAFVELRQKLESLLNGREFIIVAAEDLLEPWLPPDETRQARKAAVNVSLLFERAGFAIEPDVRFGGVRLRRGDRVVAFRLGGDHVETVSRAYEDAALLLHLAAILSWSDDTISTHEQRLLHDHVAKATGLGEAERRRLTARVEWLLAEPRAFDGVKKRVAALSETRRAELGRTLVEVVVADGHAGPAEIKALQKLFRLLSLDPGAVHEAIHTFQAGVLPRIDPETVYTADTRNRGFAIPQPPPSPASPLTKRRPELDMTAVRAKLAESAEVATLLASIFVDDQDAAPNVTGSSIPEQSVRGLDTAHSAVLARLGERAVWSIVDFEALARSFDLMPEGAIDALNEVAIDTCGAPLIEGEDPLMVDSTVYQEFMTV